MYRSNKEESEECAEKGERGEREERAEGEKRVVSDQEERGGEKVGEKGEEEVEEGCTHGQCLCGAMVFFAFLQFIICIYGIHYPPVFLL